MCLSVDQDELMRYPYLQLQFFVLLVASTALFGRLISLPAPVLVLWRTGIAALVLFVGLSLSRRVSLRLSRDKTLKVLGVGVILGVHWLTFFGSVKLSNVSICLAGMASTSFFTSLTEPLIDKRRYCWKEILLGLMIIPGLGMVAGVSWEYGAGLLCALVSAMLAALFPAFNRRLVLAGIPATVLTFYEVVAACLTCLFVIVVSDISLLSHLPRGYDWLWLGILACICTVWAQSYYAYLLKHFTAFATSMAINFEPVYGILLAAYLFHEYQDLDPLFYLGAALIIIANLVHAWILRAEDLADETSSKTIVAD